MPYSQKYTILAFLQPKIVGDEFQMTEWPLHVTLADVFAINMTEDLKAALRTLLTNELAVSTKASRDTTLGETSVVLLEKNKALLSLHTRIIDLLQSHGAIFNSPEFTRDGFLPHCTIQKSARLREGDVVTISTISLIDMFPDRDWTKRKVLQNYTLKQEKH